MTQARDRKKLGGGGDGQMRLQLREGFGSDGLAPDFGPRGLLHGGDQPRQPTPAARLATPNLALPFWPHRLTSSRLTAGVREQPSARLAVPVANPERIR